MIKTDENGKELKEFIIGEIFNLTSTKSGIDKVRLNQEPGSVPYLTRREYDNGIQQFVTDSQNEKYKKNDGNVITIGLDTQTAFYQKVPFFTGQNVNILESQNLSEKSALYIIVRLKKIMSKYGWGGNGATLGRLKSDIIELPINDNGDPDWDYMEKYISNIEHHSIKNRKLNYLKEIGILEFLNA